MIEINGIAKNVASSVVVMDRCDLPLWLFLATPNIKSNGTSFYIPQEASSVAYDSRNGILLCVMYQKHSNDLAFFIHFIPQTGAEPGG